jgi:hypothetical protein
MRSIVAALTFLLLPTSVHALTVNFRAKFTKLSADVTAASLKATDSNNATTAVIPNVIGAPNTCSSDTTNQCVDFSMVLNRSDTRDFNLCVSNALNEVACSNTVRFQVPPSLVAPSLTILTLSFQ